MTPAEVAVLLCVLGTVFAFGLATLGLFRLPDLYSRAHATSKGDTLGALFAVAGTGLAVGASDEAVKLALLLAFVFVTTPTATHAVVRAARAEGHEARTGNERGTEPGTAADAPATGDDSGGSASGVDDA